MSGPLRSSRVELEMNFAWGEAHPALMVQALVKFQAEHPANVWTHAVDLRRRGFVTLIAQRIET